MISELGIPNKAELNPQDQWDIFRAQLSYALAYPDSEEPDTKDLPSMTDLYEATPINIGLTKFSRVLFTMKKNEKLGDENAPIIIRSIDTIEIKNINLISDLHQYIGVGESTEIKPVTVFFVETDSSACMIIPMEIDYDYIVVQVCPIKGKLETQAPVLATLQDYYYKKTDLKNTKKDPDDLLKEIPGLKRGSDL